ncbi:NERD domain-containing protein [Neobacillus notoginsengisoli]|uniref:NERD domain-containing protein n=1 Tax=Neobacillus notoginsengisoli TaxID=1578198 RepID=A0A417YR16_9BACI|nr:nuclease-related domain-containing protein [Neobacillus notoginsengisoli]RHW37285.1 NERD domain-containing protein [Neobacillus notoginsengisoli]
MKLKERTVPHRVLQGEALLRNLSPQSSFYPLVENDLSKRKAGYWGETQLDYYLRLLPHEGYYILNDLRLPFKDDFFQIDCLILTTRYCLVIESKNMKGTLFFDSKFDQLIRVQEDNSEEVFEDPIVQAKNIILKLSFLLKEHYPDLPFNYLISIASTKTKLTSDTDKIDRVCHASAIVHKLFELEKQYTKDVLTPHQITNICKQFLKIHTPNLKSILKVFGIARNKLLKGIYCPCCNQQMVFFRGKWICGHCKHISKDAHIQKTMDYFLLVRPYISNQELRELLGIPTRRAARRILLGSQLPYIGERRGRIYLSPSFPQKKTEKEENIHEI